MTISNAKKMIRHAIAYGMSKRNALLMARAIFQEEGDDREAALDRFEYELNAEEQRRQSERTTN